jgi:hypothetical protein
MSFQVIFILQKLGLFPFLKNMPDIRPLPKAHVFP